MIYKTASLFRTSWRTLYAPLLGNLLRSVELDKEQWSEYVGEPHATSVAPAGLRYFAENVGRQTRHPHGSAAGYPWRLT